MRREQPTPQVALVVKWPQAGALEPLAEQLARQLADRRLAATWAIAEPQQVEAVARWSHAPARFEAAALAPAPNVLDGLKLFAAAGASAATICIGTERIRSHDFRALCQLGVRTIVSEAAGCLPGAVQPLPFGLSQFSPVLCTPAAGWLARWFGKVALDLPGDVHTGNAVVVLDLARTATAGGRGWREIDRVLHQIDEARRMGQVASATMADVAAEMSRATAARPQRSILRAA